MNVDIYDDAESWAPGGALAPLRVLYDPIRVPYFAAMLGPLGDRPRVLDVGCGAGSVMDGLADQAAVIGVDVAAGALSGTSGHLVAQADGRRLPFGDETFDAVLCSEVLEHVGDQAGVLGECMRVLRAGGRFGFSVPSRTSWSRLVLIKLAQDWSLTRVMPAAIHEWDRFLRPAELAELIGDLHVRDVRGVGVRWRDLGGVARVGWAHARGAIGIEEVSRRIPLRLIRSHRLAYIGWAEKP